MPARTSATIVAHPEIADAANFATELINRTLKLVAQGIAAEEQSPNPDIKKCAAYVSTIKRAADALKSLARLRTADIRPAATPITNAPELPLGPPAPAPTAEISTGIAGPSENPPPLPQPAPDSASLSASGRSIASSLASLSKLRGKSLRPSATTRSYGERVRSR